MSSDQEEKWLFSDKCREEARGMLHNSHDVRTICNVLRYLYTLCDKPEQKYLVEEAIWMAKKMDNKLRFYKKDWDQDLWVPEGIRKQVQS